MRISYESIGRPTEPGTYLCPSVGEVYIGQDSLDLVNEYEGAAWLECDEISAITSGRKSYTVIEVVPK